MIKVFGHLNPDTDSTCAALVYSWFLSEHRGQEAEPYLLGKPNNEALCVLRKFGFPTPELLTVLEKGDEVVLVDTSNPGELPQSIGEATIREIVDHHKLAGLSTAEPLTITSRPVACTTTIILDIIQRQGVKEIPKDIAGLMLAAIISDTLKFTSPTTTDEDRKAADHLVAIAGVSVDDLAQEMFAAKSDLTGMAPKDLLLSDSKVFTMGDKTVRVSSLETTDPQQALKIEQDIKAAALELKVEEKLDGLFFFIVDILSTSSTLLIVSVFEELTATKAFGGTVSDGRMELPGVVSRKKQMVPPLEGILVI